MTMTNASVLRFSHLVKLKHADKAKAMLEKVASLVKPLMRKHSWTLPLLSEMLPDNPGLLGLNINGGQKILLRLRPHHAQDTFLDFQDVMGTMLHELTHNVHGPHDAKFYAFLAKLIDEYDALTASGWRGDGFHSEGIRIGVGHSHDVPIHLAREKAILAAEERSRVQKLMSGSGRALGGSGAAVRTGKSPRELAAEAAERRLRDDRTCGLDQAKEAAKASRDGVIEINEDDDDDDAAAVTPVTLASSVPASGEAAASDDEIEIVEPPSTRPPLVADPSNLAAGEPLSRGTVLNRAQGPRPMAQTKPFAPVAPRGYPPALIATPVEPSAPVDVWPCPACTYHNALQASTCAICDGSRPVLSASQKAIFNRIGWTCTSCGQTEIGTEWWTCVTAGCPGVRGWS